MIITFSPCESLDPLQNSMMVKSTITLGILKLHDLIYRVALIQGQKLISSNKHAVLGIVVKPMLWNNLSYHAKRAQLVSEFKSKLLALCLLLDLSDF